jgi:16S rRNA processing protein RimM
VRVQLETDFPQRFAQMRRAFLVRDGRVEELTIINARPHARGVLLTIAGVDGPEAAGHLRGAEIAVPREAAVTLPADTYYIFEIVGLRVKTSGGVILGTVVEVMRGAAHDVYVVRGAAGDVLIPALREIVRRIDRSEGEMVVELPEGLRPPAPPVSRPAPRRAAAPRGRGAHRRAR